MFWLGFIIGLILGEIIGIIALSLLRYAKEDEK